MPNLALLENQLAYLTLRIETHYPDGSRGYGTGFIFQFPGTDGLTYFILVTNRHVVEGTDQITLVFTGRDANDQPDHSALQRHSIGADYALISFHPNPTIDLAIISLGPLLSVMEAGGNAPYIKAFKPDQIVSDEIREKSRAVQNVLMVGYPNGIWDAAHNIPIVRRGITATPLRFDHESRPEFMIDAPCFPGSSGSPVIMYDSGCYLSDDSNNTNFGTRGLLAGILYAGPLLLADGSITRRHIPTNAVSAEDIKIMINLGYCIHAKEIEGFREVLKRWGAALPE